MSQVLATNTLPDFGSMYLYQVISKCHGGIPVSYTGQGIVLPDKEVFYDPIRQPMLRIETVEVQ